MFKVMAMSKYNSLSKWKFSLTLAVFPLLANYSSVQLTFEKTIKQTKDRKYLTSTQFLLEASLDLSRAVQKAQLLLDNNTIGYIICFTNTINTANIDLFSMKCKQVRHDILAAKLYAMAHRLDIEKHYWRRYYIMQAKLYQYKQYTMGRTDKYQIGKYGTGKYGYLSNHKKSC